MKNCCKLLWFLHAPYMNKMCLLSITAKNHSISMSVKIRKCFALSKKMKVTIYKVQTEEVCNKSYLRQWKKSEGCLMLLQGWQLGVLSPHIWNYKSLLSQWQMTKPVYSAEYFGVFFLLCCAGCGLTLATSKTKAQAALWLLVFKKGCTESSSNVLMLKEKLNSSCPPLSPCSAAVTTGLDSAAAESKAQHTQKEERGEGAQTLHTERPAQQCGVGKVSQCWHLPWRRDWSMLKIEPSWERHQAAASLSASP